MTASPQDQTAILSYVTKVTNAFDAIIVQTQTDVQIEEYRQVSSNLKPSNFCADLLAFKKLLLIYFLLFCTKLDAAMICIKFI